MPEATDSSDTIKPQEELGPGLGVPTTGLFQSLAAACNGLPRTFSSSHACDTPPAVRNGDVRETISVDGNRLGSAPNDGLGHLARPDPAEIRAVVLGVKVK